MSAMVNPCDAQNLAAWDQVSCYCERGLNPDFWAEPLNALTNLGFIVAAVFVYTDLRVSRVQLGKGVILCLIVLLMSVGMGSFLFHSFATQWSRFADIVPIAIFVAVYMALALNWFVGLPVAVSVVVSGILVAITVAMFLAGSALNGSLAYAPALLSLLAVGAYLYRRKHGATDWVLAAFCVFFLSLILRTLDGWPGEAPLGCMVHQMGEERVALGTHALWHLLNAVTLYLLLRAAIANPRERRFK